MPITSSILLLVFFATAQNTTMTMSMHGRLTTTSAKAAPDRSIVIAPAGCCNCTCRENGGDYYCCSDKSRLCCAGKTVTGTTGGNGEFTLNVPPGKYDVFVDTVAASTRVASDVEMSPGKSATLELRLPKSTHRSMRKD